MKKRKMNNGECTLYYSFFFFIYVHGMPNYKLLCVGCAKDFLLL